MGTSKRKLREVVRRPTPGVLIGLDTAAVALLSLLTLVAAARTLDGGQFSGFSLAVLFATTAVSLQRATLFDPAFAAQRTSGRGVIPLWWLVLGPVVVGAATMASYLAFAAPVGTSRAMDAIMMALLVIPALSADLVRRRAMSFGLTNLALVTDAGAVVVAVAVFWSTGGGLIGITCAFSIANAAATLGLLFAVAPSSAPAPPFPLLKAIRLGRWSGLDHLLGAIATMIPLVVVTKVLDADLVGEYRLYQTALGPLNILAATMVTALGLVAWEFDTPQTFPMLRRRVARISLIVAPAATLYVLVAIPGIGAAAGLPWGETARVAMVVGVLGIANSVMPPIRAGALVLGQHWAGLVVRVIVLPISLVASFSTTVARWLPWNDPIAAVTGVTVLTSLLVWSVVFYRASSVRA